MRSARSAAQLQPHRAKGGIPIDPVCPTNEWIELIRDGGTAVTIIILAAMSMYGFGWVMKNFN